MRWLALVALRPPGGQLRCPSPAAQGDGSETSVENCVPLCQFHRDVCIHGWGWELTLRSDGSTGARSPDGTRVLHSRALPGTG